MPVARTEAGGTAAATEIFVLADAKHVIGMELEQSDRDAWLIQLIARAQAVVEESTGLRLSPRTGDRAEYVLDEPCAALAIDASDVDAVSSVIEYDGDGGETTIAPADYDVRRSAGRTYIVRSDGETFPRSCDGGLSAVVTYSVGVPVDSGQADLVSAAMGHVVASLYDGKGTTTADEYRTNPEYTRAIRLLRTQAAVA